MHLLTAKILLMRKLVSEKHHHARPDYLAGLEDAAAMTLPSEEIDILLADSRKEKK